MRDATLRDVAELAGVSARTVSNVVNGYARVTEHTREKVERAIATLGSLYREARFSRHELGEESRTRAYDSLQQLHEDLHRPVPARPEELP